ncbi:MAG: hypothetical protein RDV48_14270 [Candidatus Eremiobacteraeota bacterium]|nr:hypothetical protein [Candidatus Eremiobacteraeota bacterium]
MKHPGLVGAFLLAALVLLLPYPAPGAPAMPASPESLKALVITGLADAEKGLNDYSSQVKLKLSVSFGSLSTRLDLDGTFYYKSPRRCALKVHNGPPLINKYPQVFSWCLRRCDTGLWKVKGLNDGFYLAECTPGKGELEKQELWIDKKDFTIPYEELSYAREGKVKITSTFRNVEDFTLYDTVKASVSFPASQVKAYIHMKHGACSINKGIPESVFEK